MDVHKLRFRLTPALAFVSLAAQAVSAQAQCVTASTGAGMSDDVRVRV